MSTNEQQRQARMEAWARVASSTAKRVVDRQQKRQAEREKGDGYAVGANGDNGDAGSSSNGNAKPEEKKADEGSNVGRTIAIGVAVAVLGGLGWEMIRRYLFEDEEAAAAEALAAQQAALAAPAPGYPGAGPWMQPVPMPYPVPQYPTQAPAQLEAAPSPNTVKIEVPREQFNDNEFWRRLAGGGGGSSVTEDDTEVEWDV